MKTSEVKPIQNRAVPVSHLKEFCRQNPEVLHLKTWQVVEDHIKPLTFSSRKRYTELANVPSGEVKVFVSHCWGGGFGTLVSAVVDFCDDDTHVWIDIFAVLQHPKCSFDESQGDVINNDDLRFDIVVENAKALLLVCDVDEDKLSKYEVSSIKDLSTLKDLPPMRIWCCFEIVHAVKNKKLIFMRAGSTSKDCSSNHDGTPKAFNLTTREAVLNLYYLVDMRNAQATMPEDREWILNEMKKVGLPECNSIVKGAISNAMAVIMSPTSADFRPIENAALTENGKDIKDANYSQADLDFGFIICAAGGLAYPLQVLFDLGANPNFMTEEGDTAVQWAAHGCQLDTLTLLKKKYNADFELQGNMGWNAVIWASINSDGMKVTLNKLKELGVNVCATTNLKEEKLGLPLTKHVTRMSPIMWMTASRNKEGIADLVNDHNADINAVNAKGINAVLFAVAAEDLELLRVLTDLGADLNMIMKINDLELTAAHWAARNGKTEIARKLVELGTNDMIEDNEGFTVKELIRKNTNTICTVAPSSLPKEGVLGRIQSRSDVQLATKLWMLEDLILNDVKTSKSCCGMLNESLSKWLVY